jgi:hypothetical protein
MSQIVDVDYLNVLQAETQNLLNEIKIPLKKGSQTPFKGNHN